MSAHHRDLAQLAADALHTAAQDLDTIARSLAALYNEHWKTEEGEPDLSAEQLKAELRLREISISDGWHALKFADRGRFGGYIPTGQVQTGRVISVNLVQPWVKGKVRLPYLGVKCIGKVPQDAAPASSGSKVPLPRRAAKFKWLNPLAFDRRSRCWKGQIKYRLSQTTVSVDAPADKPPSAWADDLIGRIVPCTATATKEACRQLAEMYNESWVEDRELSASAIKRRVAFESLDVHEDESWTMWFADGGVFGGHLIRICVNSDGEITAELVG